MKTPETLIGPYVISDFDGTISMFIAHIVQVNCDLDVKNFPYDFQSCTVIYEPIFDNASRVELVVQENVYLDLLISNEEWNVSEAKAYLEYDYDDLYQYQELRLNVKLQRRPKFYIYTILIPSAALGFTGTILFIMPSIEDRIAIGNYFQ